MAGSEVSARATLTQASPGARASAGDNGVRLLNLSFIGWTWRLVVWDAAAMAISAAAVLLTRFDLTVVSGVDYRGLAAALVPTWVAAMAISRTYDRRVVTAGTDQYRRVVQGTIWLIALIALLSFALHVQVSRELTFVSVPCAAVLTIISRFAARKRLYHAFAKGCCAHRVLAIGAPREANELIAHLHRASHVGLRVVAALTPGHTAPPLLPIGVTWAGSDLDDALRQAGRFGADTLAIAGSHPQADGGLRSLSWALEGTGIALLVAPAVTDVAGPRIRVRPVDGLPLLQIERPELNGPTRLVKIIMDRALAALLILLLSPVLIACAVGVKLSSRGPIIFSQVRLGFQGGHFAMWKFRSMKVGSDVDRIALQEENDLDGGLFKIRRDPRITAFGRFMRRWSIDELPQLFNVLSGTMSLVGPRPLPVADIERFQGPVRRRLLVKPGMTGLWQVSGRADLPWEECVRLDLYYVENWSVTLDLIVLWRTFWAVVRGRGAY